MKKFTRIVSALLALLISASAAACANSADTQDNSDNPDSIAETESDAPVTIEQLFDGIEKKNYDGEEFRFFARGSTSKALDVYTDEGYTGEILNDVTYERNMAVSEYFNVVFALSQANESDYETEAYDTIAAGDDIYDVIVPHARAAISGYGDDGIMINWYDIPGVRLDREWWNQDAQKSLSVKHKLFAMTGDLSVNGLGAAMALMFNKKLFNDYNFQFPYDDVLNGTWTFEKFKTIVSGATSDLNGDGKIEINDDQSGYVTYKWAGPVQSFTAFGLRVLDKDEDDVPYITFMNNRTSDVFDSLCALYDSDYAFIDDEWSTDSGWLGAFMSGRALFTDLPIGDTTYLRDMSDDFGILPYPKWTEEDDYKVNVDGGCNMFIVPITEKDPEMVGLVLEALAVYGNKYVIPAYYDIVLKGKGTRDNESEHMLDIIKNARVYDLGYFDFWMGGPLANKFMGIMQSNERNLASWYEANWQATQNVIDQLLALDTFN